MNRLHQIHAAILQATSQPNRLRILQLLGDGERCVQDIVTALDEEQSNISRHLGHLHRCGLLRRRKEGLRIIYSIKHPEILLLIDTASAIARRELAEGEPPST